MYARNCWYVAAWDYEVPVGTLVPMRIADQLLVIWRDEAGEPIVLEDRCCHRFAPLSRGQIEDGCTLRCMYHGLKFDRTGTCVEIPGQDNIPPTARVKSYPAVLRESWIWVWLGEPALADPALIPAVKGLDDPVYNLRSGQLNYEANYLLINDNLTDFSHLPYVHANSFGSSELWARIRPKVRRIERGIRITRWLPAREAQSGGALAGVVAERTAAMASWQSYDFVVPGILTMYNAIHRVEDIPADGESPPTAEPISSHFSSQAVTPTGERTTRYFYSFGPRRADGDDQLAERMFAVAEMAFGEDREMIEAQQKVIDVRPGNEVLTSADVGPVQIRRLIRQMAGEPDPEPGVKLAQVG